MIIPIRDDDILELEFRRGLEVKPESEIELG